MLLRPILRRGFAAALVALAGQALDAQVTIGTATEGGGLCIPLGCSNGEPSRYQQVYAAGAFGGAMAIGALTFHHTQVSPGDGEFAPVTLALSFSITSRGPGALSTVFDDNVGMGARHFATVTLAGSAAAPSFTIAGTPFDYDPSLGNLLVDWRILGPGDPSRPFFFNTYFDADYDGLVTSAVVDAEWVPGLRETSAFPEALVTTFTPAVSAVPEPATMALVATGLATLGVVVRLRRRAH